MNSLVGMGVALVTPFKSDLSVDHEALAKVVEFNIENGTDYLVISGTTGERPAGLGKPNPELGDTRWNTTIGVLETWNGTEYISAAGVSAAISQAEFDDLLLEYTIIFG